MSTASLAAPKPKRLLSLDVVRGITIAFMIMVNNNGGSPWHFMNHAAWNGLTATDMVFPTFLFIVGISTVFGTEARLAKGASRGELARHTIIRALVLILFGWLINIYGGLLNSFPHFHIEHMRFYGVLQRIGLCYLVVGLFYLVDKSIRSKVAVLVVCLLGYWALVTLVPVPGQGMPGRDFPVLDGEHNIVNYVDEQLLPGHLYEDWTTHNLRDPEGLLSDIPALGTALLGMITGILLRKDASVKKKALGLALGCVALLAVGYLWSIWLPLNKKMWSSSYVLVAAGWSLALLTVAFWVIEVKNWRKGWTYPWLVFGSNAIVAYMFSELFFATINLFHFTVNGRSFVTESWAQSLYQTHIPDAGWAAFCWSVSFAALCFIPVWILYRKKIFVKI